MDAQQLQEITDYVTASGFCCRTEENSVVIACPGRMNGRVTYNEAKVATMRQAVRVVQSMQ